MHFFFLSVLCFLCVILVFFIFVVFEVIMFILYKKCKCISSSVSVSFFFVFYVLVLITTFFAVVERDKFTFKFMKATNIASFGKYHHDSDLRIIFVLSTPNETKFIFPLVSSSMISFIRCGLFTVK